MNPASNTRSGGREAPASAKEVDTKHKQTRTTDIRPEDAERLDSGQGRGTAAERVMKQEHKTDQERGSR